MAMASLNVRLGFTQLPVAPPASKILSHQTAMGSAPKAPCLSTANATAPTPLAPLVVEMVAVMATVMVTANPGSAATAWLALPAKAMLSSAP